MRFAPTHLIGPPHRRPHVIRRRAAATRDDAQACDAIYMMLRAFDDPDVTHVEGDVDPVRGTGRGRASTRRVGILSVTRTASRARSVMISRSDARARRILSCESGGAPTGPESRNAMARWNRRYQCMRRRDARACQTSWHRAARGGSRAADRRVIV